MLVESTLLQRCHRNLSAASREVDAIVSAIEKRHGRNVTLPIAIVQLWGALLSADHLLQALVRKTESLLDDVDETQPEYNAEEAMIEQAS